MSQGGDNNIPNWLRQMSGWEDTPEWLLKLIEQAEGTLSFEDLGGSLEEMGFDASDIFSSQEPSEQEEALALADLESEAADWFSGLEAPQEGETAPSAGAQEAGEDWLEGLGEDIPAPTAAAEAVEAQDDQGAGVDDWLSGLDDLPPAEELAEADWLVDEDAEELTEALEEPLPVEPIEPAEPAEEEVPDWMSGLDAGSFADVVSGEGVEPPAEGIPDWLSGLDAGAPVEAGPTEVAAPAEEGAPDWLTGLGADVPASTAEEVAPVEVQETGVPDWLSGLDAGAPVEAEPTEEGAPDWLGGLDVEVPEGAAEEAAPDWLTGLDVDVPEGIAEEAASAEEQETGAPDWLSGLDAGAPVEAGPTEIAEPAEEGVPDWLAAIDTSSPRAEAAEDVLAAPVPSAPAEYEEEAGLPDWLADVDAGVPDEAEEEEPTAEGDQEAGVPDWLRSFAQEGPAEQPPEQAVVDLKKEEPDQEGQPVNWLEDMGEVATGPEPVTQKGVTAWLTEVRDMPVPEEKVPEEEIEQEPESMPEWLRDLDTGAAAREEAPTRPEISMEMPDWLREAPPDVTPTQVEPTPIEPSLPVGETSVPSWMEDSRVPQQETTSIDDLLGLPAQGEAAAVETPDWVAELRDQEAGPPKEELPVETSGPLAGLRGVLNPEPLLAILPKSGYRPLPPIPDTHYREAKLVEQVLEPVSQPTPVSRSPGRQVMASLARWLMYVILLATIVVSPLRGAVIPVDLLEAQSFTNTINALPDGSEVLLVIDYDASLDGELTPQTRAIIWHLLQKNLGIVTVSFTPQGLTLAQELFLAKATAIEGQQYVNLGYLPPHPASIQAFIDNPFGGAALWETTSNAAQTSLGQRVRQFDDLDLIVMVSGDQDHVRWWVEQVGSQKHIKIIAGVSAAIAPYIQPYYAEKERGQIKGMLVGLAAVPQYEQLTGTGVTPSSWENYVVLANTQILLAAVMILGTVSSMLKRSPRQAPRQIRWPRRARAEESAGGDK
jgi:hypothetical protein